MNEQDAKRLSDEELVKIVRTTDQEAYGELVERYQDKLLRYATYLVNDSDVAVDVVQDSFLKAFMNLQGFNTAKKFSSWVYRIVHNEAINHVKRQKRNLSLETHKWLHDVLTTDDDAADEVGREEVAQMLRACLAELPLRYREPLVLFYLEDRSYDEISDVLRIPMGTVGTRVSRGRGLLKVVYNKRNGEHDG